MTIKEKLQILNTLIERAELATYDSDTDMIRCKDDVKSFIRNTMSKDSPWIERINSITWSTGVYYDGMLSIESVKSWENGQANLIGVLLSIKSEIELYSNVLNNKQGIKSEKVFIVHGHNDEMKLAVARLISQLNLKPIILHEQPNKGRTIIEKFEKLSEDVSFAVVLLSADDVMQDGKFRVRQNVILELGYFIAKLGRENVVALYDISTEVEIPSDITGVLYEPYDNSNGIWRFEVVQELKAAGFDVDANALTQN